MNTQEMRDKFKALDSTIAQELVSYGIGFSENLLVETRGTEMVFSVPLTNSKTSKLAEKSSVVIWKLGQPDCYVYIKNNYLDVNCQYARAACIHLGVIMKNISTITSVWQSHANTFNDIKYGKC